MAIAFFCDCCNEQFDRKRLLTRQDEHTAESGSELFCPPCEKLLGEWRKAEEALIARHRAERAKAEEIFIAEVRAARSEFVRDRRGLPAACEPPRESPSAARSVSKRSKRRAPRIEVPADA